MFDFTPPADPKLAAMVSHARQLLLRAPTPESLALYFGVESVDSLDVLEIERSLSDGHHIDYQDAEHLNELVSWLESYVREEPAFESLIGHDPVFLHVLALAREQAERTSTLRDLCPVRIMGPTGSGKELLARAIHRASGLSEESFVAVHCAGITDELLESTLFGYEGRAFTGASSKGKDGLVSKAEGGTLFLDEVGDLPPRAQVTLLRFLQDQRYRRVGGIDELQANVRVMCATWKDLEALAKKELFRRDLLYRLSGARLELPSLLARRDELLDVAEAMLVRAGVAEQPPVDPQARLVIGHTGWPGNFRQLDMELREAARKSGGSRVRLMHLAPERLAAFYGAGQVLRLASEVVAWSPAGVAPDGEVLTTRTRKALEHIQVAPVQESSEAGLLLQVRDAFEDTDRPHALLGQFVNLVGQQRSLHQQKARMAELAALLPEEAQAPIQARQDQLAQQSSEAESAVEKASAEIATRLPGLFQVFSFVHSLPGLSDREKTALFRSLGVILQFVTILVPSIAAYGIQRLASNTIEDFLLDEDEGHDPNNPFILEKKPAQRSEEDWRWLEQNTSSLREAAQISGYSRNTVKGYFERHKLLDVSE